MASYLRLKERELPGNTRELLGDFKLLSLSSISNSLSQTSQINPCLAYLQRKPGQTTGRVI
jgi:hypothetical protein